MRIFDKIHYGNSRNFSKLELQLRGQPLGLKRYKTDLFSSHSDRPLGFRAPKKGFPSNG